jgi:hypothetical protein
MSVHGLSDGPRAVDRLSVRVCTGRHSGRGAAGPWLPAAPTITGADVGDRARTGSARPDDRDDRRSAGRRAGRGARAVAVRALLDVRRAVPARRPRPRRPGVGPGRLRRAAGRVPEPAETGRGPGSGPGQVGKAQRLQRERPGHRPGGRRRRRPAAAGRLAGDLGRHPLERHPRRQPDPPAGFPAARGDEGPGPVRADRRGRAAAGHPGTRRPARIGEHPGRSGPGLGDEPEGAEVGGTIETALHRRRRRSGRLRGLPGDVRSPERRDARGHAADAGGLREHAPTRRTAAGRPPHGRGRGRRHGSAQVVPAVGHAGIGRAGRRPAAGGRPHAAGPPPRDSHPPSGRPLGQRSAPRRCREPASRT